jgi:Ca-activated chloride channel homolog
MSAILKLWHQHKKAANLVLVFDTSGSMNQNNKIASAKSGAEQLLSQLDDSDLLSLLPFSGEMHWSGQGIPMSSSRDRARQTVSGLIADGGTRLYDSVDAAVQYLQQHPMPDKISAVVVLTDGQDTESQLKLDGLIQRIQSDGEKRSIRVFTIGYGNDADESVLKRIADVTQAKYYKGTPQNIREVFREIATFF